MTTEHGELQGDDFNAIISLIEGAKSRALQKVNEELVLLYLAIGKVIAEKINSAEWGSSIVDELARRIKKKHPELKGFTRRGLYRMKQFYETYTDLPENVSALLTQINWTSHLMILSKTKTVEEKIFYIQLAVREYLTTRELERQLNSAVFERTMLAQNSVSALPTQPKTTAVFKDTYIFDFLDLPRNYTEKDLQQSLLENLKDFILELGKGFSFVGNEYRVEVGNHDYYIDLLFYHRDLQCLVALELKIEEFKPEFLGKMNFYLEALDRNLKRNYENPSIGILLCKGKDKEVVEFSMARTLSPTMVAEYETKLIDKEVLQRKLHELFSMSSEGANDE